MAASNSKRKTPDRTTWTPRAIGGAARRRELGLVSLVVEITPEERQAIRVAAAQAGESMAAFIRRVLKETAK